MAAVKGSAASARLAALAASLAVLALLPILATPQALRTAERPPVRTLFAQSIQAALSTSGFPSTRISWLLLDARTGELLASQWPGQDQPVPVGSLTKPFLAIAYARTHSTFPHFTCKGRANRCWLPKGHGTLGLEDALAVSCNFYFLNLAQQTSPAAMQAVAVEYGLPAPPAAATPAQLIGLDASWRIAPLTLASAYVRLATHSSSVVLAGMRRAALTGTASPLALDDAIAKTGTARCIHDCIATADGFVVALTPTALTGQESPRLLLLVRQRGTTGAAAAYTAARMLKTLRQNHVID